MTLPLTHIDSAFTTQYKGFLETLRCIAEQLGIWPGVFFSTLSFWNCFGENGMAENNNNYIGLYHFLYRRGLPRLIIEFIIFMHGRACSVAAGRDVACRVSTTERTDVDCTDVACRVSTGRNRDETGTEQGRNRDGTGTGTGAGRRVVRWLK